MDAVDPDRFARITRVSNGYERVLAGIRAAREVGLWPVKVNCVLMRGFNEDQIIPFGMFAREEGVIVRFIEFMPLEEDRVWAPNTVVPLEEIVSRMNEYRPLIEIPHQRSETARRYRFDDGIGEIGIIAPVSHPFCGHCSRIRITSDGKIRTCLFSVWDHDLHAVMRRGGSDEEMTEFIRGRGHEERRAPSHRRARFRSGIKNHGAYRRVRASANLSGGGDGSYRDFPSLEAQFNQDARTLHEGVEVLRLGMTPGNSWYCRNVVTFLVAFNDYGKFALRLHGAIYHRTAFSRPSVVQNQTLPQNASIPVTLCPIIKV